MNISPLLFHRSLGLDINTPEPTDFPRVFTSFLYHDIDYDASTRFVAKKKGARGHSRGVNCIGADERDGRWMVTGGADGSVLIWDLETEDHGDEEIKASAAVLEKDRPSHGISSIRFNPHNCSLFSTTSYSSTLSLYSLTPTNPLNLQTYPLDSHLYTHSVSPVSTSTALIAVCGFSPHKTNRSSNLIGFTNTVRTYNGGTKRGLVAGVFYPCVRGERWEREGMGYTVWGYLSWKFGYYQPSTGRE